MFDKFCWVVNAALGRVGTDRVVNRFHQVSMSAVDMHLADSCDEDGLSDGDFVALAEEGPTGQPGKLRFALVEGLLEPQGRGESRKALHSTLRLRISDKGGRVQLRFMELVAVPGKIERSGVGGGAWLTWQTLLGTVV